MAIASVNLDQFKSDSARANGLHKAAQADELQSPVYVLHRIGQKDRSAVKECIDAYGDWIWGMAKMFTNSTEAAEAVTENIFLHIWQNAERYDDSKFDERTFIAMIARLEIREHLKQSPDNKQDNSISA
ncbi:MAG: RNA polymerase sigma factor [Pyrinomonadaceae bacterium]